MSDTTNVTVPVPADRLPEFYRWFADWTEKVPSDGTEELGPAQGSHQVDAAVRWWELLKPNERKIFGIWLEAAPGMVSARDIVDRLELRGPRDIAGILSWPGRKGRKVGFDVRWSFRTDPVTEDPMYGIEDAGYADVIRQARAAVEGDV